MRPTEKTTKQVLIEARALIADETHWLNNGRMRKKLSDGSFAYCALGACNEAYGGYSGGFVDTDGYALLSSKREDDSRGVGHFNDTHSHAEILAWFNRAIEAA